MEDKVKEQVEKEIECIIEEGIQGGNLDMLGKLVDIHKDLENEDYWNVKKEAIEMNYRGEGGYGRGSYGNHEDYGEYGRRRRDERGRYARRGVAGTGRGRYRGEDVMDEMYGAYQNYSEGREEYGRGNYGAKSETLKSLDYMLQSVVEFIEMLKKDATSQEEIELIQKYAQEIGEM